MTTEVTNELLFWTIFRPMQLLLGIAGLLVFVHLMFYAKGRTPLRIGTSTLALVLAATWIPVLYAYPPFDARGMPLVVLSYAPIGMGISAYLVLTALHTLPDFLTSVNKALRRMVSRMTTE